MDSNYLGQIQPFGFNFAPRGWALCNGQIMPISQNTALFSLLGTYYGGNGQSTFALPNLQGRVAVGMGQSPGTSYYEIGQAAGNEDVTLLQTQMPIHVHSLTGGSGSLTVKVSANPATASTPSNGVATLAAGVYPDQSGGGADTPSNMYNNDTAPGITLGGVTSSGGGGGSTNTGSAGGSQPFSILQPYLAINYSIALQGVFPSRN